MIAETLIAVAAKLFDKVIPDPQQAAVAKLKLFELQQTGELAALQADLELAKGQMQVNTVEANSDALFKSGWRPFIGWTCGMAFSFNFLIFPATKMIAAMHGMPFQLDPLDLTEMMPVLLGMLGLGGFRTYEKVKGRT